MAIASVSNDVAYDTKACHTCIASPDAAAIIPVRENDKPWKENSVEAYAHNETLWEKHRLGRCIWKRWSGYDRHSLVENKMGCLKLLGERVASRDFERQVTEIHIRVAQRNRLTELTPRNGRNVLTHSWGRGTLP